MAALQKKDKGQKKVEGRCRMGMAKATPVAVIEGSPRQTVTVFHASANRRANDRTTLFVCPPPAEVWLASSVCDMPMLTVHPPGNEVRRERAPPLMPAFPRRGAILLLADV